MSSMVIRVWDLPTRIFHWALVACIVGSITTSQIGGNAMIWHMRFGLLIGSLLLFRVIWGFVGGRWSRFASFLRGPASILAYLGGRGKPEDGVGHNPLGALSVIAMLLALIAQVTAGLMADDEIATAGPLTRFVKGSWVSVATSYHKSWGKYLLITLVLLHILAILYYVFVKRQRLVRPMLGGDKPVDTGTATVAPSRDDAASRLVALVVFALCAGLMAWVASLGG